MNKKNNIYDENTIKTLDWREHIRTRPGMYIGKIGDGSSSDDGIYILLKEIIDNSIDEYIMGYGSKIDIRISSNQVTVRDYGRGIPLGKLADCVSKINTGGKYDSDVFQKSVGLNGVGTKAVNALSDKFIIQSFGRGYRKLLIVTGKGKRSRVNENPYVSKKFSVLKHSVPEFIKNNENLNKKVIKISTADNKHGGEGAIYIFLKNSKSL